MPYPSDHPLAILDEIPEDMLASMRPWTAERSAAEACPLAQVVDVEVSSGEDFLFGLGTAFMSDEDEDRIRDQADRFITLWDRGEISRVVLDEALRKRGVL